MRNIIISFTNSYKGRPHHLPGVLKDRETIAKIVKDTSGLEWVEVSCEFTANDFYQVLYDNLRNLSAQDIVHIYGSGHGITFNTDFNTEHQGFFCELAGESSIARDTDVIKFLQHVTKAQVYVIWDICFSGGMRRAGSKVIDLRKRFIAPTVKMIDELPKNTFEIDMNTPINKKIYFICASTETEPAYDTDEGGMFTLALFIVLKRELKLNPKLSWASLVEKAGLIVKDFQHPVASVPKTKMVKLQCK